MADIAEQGDWRDDVARRAAAELMATWEAEDADDRVIDLDAASEREHATR